MLGLSSAEWLATSAAVCLGSVLQAVTGLGAGLVIVPFLALISTALIPAPLVFASLSLSLCMLWFGRRSIDFRYTSYLLAGVGLGSIIAAAFVSQLPAQKLGLAFGIVILGAVVFSLFTPKFTFNRQGGIFAGLISGLAGTTSGIGAPFLLGYLLSPILVTHIEKRWARAAVLVVSSLSALVLIAKSI